MQFAIRKIYCKEHLRFILWNNVLLDIENQAITEYILPIYIYVYIYTANVSNVYNMYLSKRDNYIARVEVVDPGHNLLWNPQGIIRANCCIYIRGAEKYIYYRCLLDIFYVCSWKEYTIRTRTSVLSSIVWKREKHARVVQPTTTAKNRWVRFFPRINCIQGSFIDLFSSIKNYGFWSCMKICIRY